MLMVLLQLLFWTCLLLVAHTYVLFPLLLARLARTFPGAAFAGPARAALARAR